MNRVFLDANVLFSAAWRENAGLLCLWGVKGTLLLASHYAAEEARRNLETDEQRHRLVRLMTAVDVVADDLMGTLPDHVILPQKDRPILLAAINACATHLLTGDKQHFGALFGQTIGGVLVLRPADYPALA